MRLSSGAVRARFIYTGIRVRDLERSVGFYTKNTKTMGMKEVSRGRMRAGGTYVQLRSKGSGQKLELNWYPKRSCFYERYKNGSELDHIGFIVDDAEKWFKLLIKRGAKPAAKPFGDESETLAYVKDPDGVWIELIGPAKKPKQPKS